MEVRGAGTLRDAFITRRLFTVDEYHRMAEAGIVAEDDRVELIEGEIVEMTPIGSRHAACVMKLTRLLVRVVGEDGWVSPQSPVRLGERLEPQPDLAVLRLREGYSRALPAADVLLLVEVSDTSLPYDRGVKLPLYARSGIPEVWIFDLAGKTIERYSEPAGEGYRRGRGGRVHRAEPMAEHERGRGEKRDVDNGAAAAARLAGWALHDVCRLRC